MTSWGPKISSFLSSPSQFLSCTTAESFLAELLDELRDDKASDNKKILLLSVLLEHPGVLCPTTSAGEGTAQELISILTYTPQKSVTLKCHLMLAITNVLICTTCLASQAKVAEDFLNFLFRNIQDTNDNSGGLCVHALRATACECLREMENCQPGLLSQKLEALYYLKNQETTVLHQSYSLLYSLGLKNAIHLLAKQKNVDNAKLRGVLSGNEGFVWKAIDLPLSVLPFGMISQVPQLPTTLDCKDLRSIMSLLLEESYLMTPASQVALLRGLVEIVAMVPAITPAVFKSQLLRLFGTTEVELMHATLIMKGTFTDSLFTAEDENFLLKRLTGMAQHPLLKTPEKLFYMDCILHFPENRPISSSGEESLPVLVTPQLTLSLFPTVFDDSTTMLCRLNLLCLVLLEADEDEESKGLSYLFDHLMALLKIVNNQGSRDMITMFFRATFIFLMHFNHIKKFSKKLVSKLCELYSKNCHLAPNMINLADKVQECFEDSIWSVRLLTALQKCIVEMPPLQLTLQNLSWHLKILARVALESQIAQRNTIHFLLNILINSNLCERRSWQVGTAILTVCRNLLQHPTLNEVFIELADLLQHMLKHYEDSDIQDHARFYYTLLTNLSWEKLAGVLAKAPEGGQMKVRSMSAIVAESDGLTSCLTVQKPEGCVLQLTKIDKTDSQGVGPITESQEALGQRDLFEVYQDQFKSPGFASEVTLCYNLTHASVKDVGFDRIYTICLHFDLNTSHYAEVKDIHVPCLFRDRKPPQVNLTLRPHHPYPTSLRVSALFTTEDGLSWNTQLPDVEVSFPEIFLPMPLPQGTSPESKEEVFDKIWKNISSGEPSSSETSLYCFKTDRDTLANLIEEYFKGYLVAQTKDQVCKVLFYLPPFFHVLLMISEAEDAVQLRIATENSELLPHINSYLQSITGNSSLTNARK
ncbi:AP-5 complex subunit beta-1-like [Trichomycterus rosablanca]|uniref:AP-5 complex subunit beta-1 n=1 Tax=Trichomycterus rosablanca TaxID=2290929 RepID=UPI002F359EC4